MVFTIYGHCGHLGQWTATILAIFRSPILRKFEQNGSAASDKSFENVKGQADGPANNGQKVITIVHPERSSGELKMLP